MRTNIFIHIPKCGGSTIRDAMLRRFKTARTVRIYGDNGKEGMFSVESFIAGFPTGLTDKVAAVSGHVPYADLMKVIKHNKPSDYNIFSVVRNPIDRAISNINYMKLKDYHGGHVWASSISSESLFNTLCKGAKNSGWGQTQADFLGYGEYFKTLKDILGQLAVYKIENLNTALLENGIIDNENDPVEVKNVSVEIAESETAKASLLSKDDLTSQQISELEKLCKIDCQLHQMAM